MIPSIVVSEIRSALVEYLSSTFALSNDEVRSALSTFLQDNADGIFRGPYVKVRTPFRPVAPSWTPPLDWIPDGFVPHEHQASAFARLSTADGRVPAPTLVTTGTGSGKTECFLYPVLDHCARERSAGRSGIKALILYPMNALASDQAGRIAALIHRESRLAGVTAGLYVGEAGRHSSMGADHIIDRREVLRADPPDILLTNYKMLDFLLLRQEDRDLWAVNTPDTLRYVVLDEFHTYDGAQGTDVAMLLRRLGATLGMATADSPLGSATPVATSATLGTGAQALVDLRLFARKVFGIEFDEQSVIGETRQSVEEACSTIDFLLPIPDAADVEGLTETHDIISAFCTKLDGDKPAIDDPVALGDTLLTHPLTRAVLRAVGEQSRSWPDALAEIVAFAPNWGRDVATGRGPAVEAALTRYLQLLSIARRRQGDRDRPLFSVEVQLWVREVSRMLRAVDRAPSFRWRDSAAPIEDEPSVATAGAELPAIYCRRCGQSGWMALSSEMSDSFGVNPNTIYTTAMQRSPQVRALMQAHPEDPDRRWYSARERRLVDTAEPDTVPVLITPTEDDARANRCPACGERDAVRFIGSAVASMASVAINTLFASPHLEHDERKLLAFTDSVQDASHRAGFFGSRTHRINLRSLMSRIVQRDESVDLADLGDLLLAEADTARARFELVPPDLLRHPLVRTVWSDHPAPGALETLASRLGFEVDLEFGLRARVGRTLELTRSAAAEVRLDDLAGIAALVGEEIRRVTGDTPDPGRVELYVRGLLERTRLRGGLRHDLLDPFVEGGGKQWFIWGGRPDGLPPFTPGQGRPSFFTTGAKGDLDSLTGLGPNALTWVVDWAVRVLGLDAADARNLNVFTFAVLAKESDTVVATRVGNNTVYGLDRRSITVVDVAESGSGPEVSHLVCDICGQVHVAPPRSVDVWAGGPCLRFRCIGTLRPSAAGPDRYYRNLYRQGATRRVVTGEHTGLLGRAAREDLEAAFKAGTAPNAPNVLTATPTLEMGIDIGDLSAVMLTSVPRNPASYIQRVGRAGRATGNALITTFVRTDTHGLYYLSDPQAMIAGDVRPPSCYLDAIETLQRQYVAYLIDRIADQSVDAPVVPRQIGALMRTGFDDGSFLRALIDTSMLDGEHVERFLSLFGEQLQPATLERLRAFAAAGIEAAVKNAVATWQGQAEDLGKRRQRLTGNIERLEERSNRTHEEEIELASLRGQRAALVHLLNSHRNEYTLTALERLGLLPNYTLVDDAITLNASMWSRDEAGGYETELFEYRRSGRLALRELAPGNSFYAGGHRHVIDALEIGSAQEPLYESWRLCPDCGYATLDDPSGPPRVCNRCAGQAIADTGARHKMLRLRVALSSGSEEGARVFDDADERQRVQYVVVSAVDIEPEHVVGAWSLAERAFGAEFAGRTHLRSINVGFTDRPGESVPIAGQGRHVTRFAVCAHCGAVREARDDRDGTRPERLHQGWCKVRSGAMRERWDEILLFHELTTEAIRMLVPVSMFEIEERLASFKGALMLGLREDFGGDPDHLEVVSADSPNRSGQGRRRFLLLFDRVPGGTGYLARMADPDRMRSLLESGRNVIARCQCASEGRSACHRCLLGVVDRNEYDLVRRDLALEILDDLLENWEPGTIATVGDLDIGQVEESELERKFKIALREWAERNPDVARFQTVPGNGKYAAFELRLTLHGRETRYRIDEQEGLATTPNSIPDYLIRRMDAKSPEVAVYLDGYQFHASKEINNIASDAQKRRAARDSGRLVWNLVWSDVDAFHKAAVADPPREPAATTLLKGVARTKAQEAQLGFRGQYSIDVMNQNPMALLLDYLSRPDTDEWRRLVLSGVTGLAASATQRAMLSADEIEPAVRRALSGAAPTAASATPPAAVMQQITTSDDLPLTLVIDVRQGAASERWTVIAALDDSLSGDEAMHRRRWLDWLHWSNLLQFVSGAGRDHVLSASSEAADLAIDNLWLVDAASSVAADAPAGAVDISQAMTEELEFVDEAVAALVVDALRGGAPDFVAGYELAGVPLEAAWPDLKVAVLVAGEAGSSDGGWDARPIEEWTSEELLNVIKERR